MEILKTQNGTELTLTIKGKIDSRSTPELEEALNKALDGITRLILDFKEVDYITSAGLRAILATQTTMDDSEGELIIRSCDESVKEVFNLTGFSKFLKIE